jgi:multidrug resistance efflux pump
VSEPTLDRNGPVSLQDRVRSLRLPDRQSGGGSSWLPWALCAVLGLTTAYFGYVIAAAPAPAKEAEKSAADKLLDDAPHAVREGPRGDVALEAKGYIIPARQIQVSPKVGGTVLKLDVVEGKRVKEGEILCVIEDIDYKADHDRCVAALAGAKHRLGEMVLSLPDETEQAKAELDSAEADYKQFFQEWKRNQNLTGTRAVAARDFEVAESGVRMQERKVERLRLAYKMMFKPREERICNARADVRQAEADLAKAKWKLENCIVRAPITGMILTKKTEQFNTVNPVAFNVSASICEMADLCDLEVDLSIQERDIANVFRGQKCRIRPDAFPNRLYNGVVSRLMPIADRAKGSISVRVSVTVPREEEGLFLRPDGSVLVSFQHAEDKKK